MSLGVGLERGCVWVRKREIERGREDAYGLDKDWERGRERYHGGWQGLQADGVVKKRFLSRSDDHIP